MTYPERRATCDLHTDMAQHYQQHTVALAELNNSLRWHTRIGYGIFLVGCAVCVLFISTIFNAGKLSQKVETNSVHLTKIERSLNNHIERSLP